MNRFLSALFHTEPDEDPDLRIRYRVYAQIEGQQPILLLSSTSVDRAEEFCRDYDGNQTVLIQQVWIPK